MDISTVKQHIMSGKLDDFYIFTGEELAVMDIYIKQIATKSNLTLKRVDTLADAYKNFHSNSFTSTKACYVIRDDKDFQSNDKLWPDFESGKVLNGNKVIFVYSNMDKRWKLTKHFADRTVVFDYLKDDVLKTYILRDIHLNDTNCDKLINLCEHSYSRILLEINKIFIYGQGFPEPNCFDNAFEELLRQGVIYQPPLDAVFDLVDAILKKKVVKSYTLYNECVKVGEATLVILSNLYNTARAVLQLQTCTSSDVSKSTGLNGWQIKNAKDKTGYYSESELQKILKLTRDMEKGIKIGTIEDAIAVPYLLANIFM